MERGFELGAEPVPSQGNFVYARFDDPACLEPEEEPPLPLG